MGTPYLGRGLTAGIGVESTWGTAVSRTNWLRLTGAHITIDDDVRPRPHFGRLGETAAVRREVDHLARRASGYIEWLLSYDDSTLLMIGAAMGASSVATTGSGPYTHTHTLKEALPVGLTVELIRGNGSAQVFEGGLVTRLTISGSAGEILRCRADMVFETGGALTSAGSPTYSSNGAPVIYHQAGNLTHGSLNDKIKAIEVVLDNSLNVERALFGSNLISKPVRNDFASVTARITREWDGTVEHAAYLAGTAGDAAITFTGASPLSFGIEVHNAEIVDNPLQAITSAGAQDVAFTLMGMNDGTDQGLEIVVVNGNSSAVAN